MVITLVRAGALALAVILAIGMIEDILVLEALSDERRDQRIPFTEAITQYGMADWTNGVVRATGVGFPPKDAITPLHAKTMAQRAALSVALRNLLEVLQGVRVDSTTTVKNYMVSNDEIHVRVDGMIERAKIVKEEQLPDGSYEVIVEMDMKGELSGLILPRPTGKPKKLPGTPPQGSITSRPYTGLVVDARGTGAQPAMAPKILNEEGQEAYSLDYLEGQQLASNGIVVYVPDLSSAQDHPRVTNQPLIVKAVRTAAGSKSDLVISNADAQTIHGVPEHFHFLQKAKVLVVLDKLK